MWIIRARRDVSNAGDTAAPDRAAIRWLALGFLLFGLARALPHLSQIVGGFLSLFHVEEVNAGRFPTLSEIKSLAAIALLWPPFLALILWRVNSRLAMRAAAITAATIALSAVVLVLMPANGAGRPRVSGPGPLAPNLESVFDEVAGGILLLLALRVELLRREKVDQTRQAEKAGSRAIAGRLTVLASCVFLLITIGGHGWNLLTDTLARSQSARSFMLNIGNTVPLPGGTLPPANPADQEVARLLNKAMELNYSNRFQEAVEAYDAAGEASSRIDASEELRPARAQTRSFILNNQAWLLATCTDSLVRDPVRSVKLAKRAIELVPEDGNTWNTLGVAHYRVGDWQAALTALERSMELRNGGDPHDWFFVAMIHVQLGDRDEAGRWYDRAVQGVEGSRRFDEELYRFRAEAARLLGRSVPPPPTISDQRAPFGLAPTMAPPQPRR